MPSAIDLRIAFDHQLRQIEVLPHEDSVAHVEQIVRRCEGGAAMRADDAAHLLRLVE